MTFKSSSGNVLTAGEKGLLILTVVNEREISVENVVVDIGEEEESGDLCFERSLVLSMIGSPATLSKEILFSHQGRRNPEKLS